MLHRKKLHQVTRTGESINGQWPGNVAGAVCSKTSTKCNTRIVAIEQIGAVKEKKSQEGVEGLQCYNGWRVKKGGKLSRTLRGQTGTRYGGRSDLMI